MGRVWNFRPTRIDRDTKILVADVIFVANLSKIAPMTQRIE